MSRTSSAKRTPASEESIRRIQTHIAGGAPLPEPGHEDFAWLGNLKSKLDVPRKVKSESIPPNPSTQDIMAAADAAINKIPGGRISSFREWLPQTRSVAHKLTVPSLNDATDQRVPTTNADIQIHYVYQGPMTSMDLESRPAANMIAAVEKAVAWFANIVPYDYQGLLILVALNPHTRIIRPSIDQSRKQSEAFCASGVTFHDKKMIMVTKKDGLIRLLLHELIHYTRLDAVLLEYPVKLPWSTGKSNYNLCEAYAEALSVILHVVFYDLEYGVPMNQTFQLELEHNLGLMADIMTYAGIRPDQVATWMQGGMKPFQSPIAIWEYVFLRWEILGVIDRVLEMSSGMRVAHAAAEYLQKMPYMERDTMVLISHLMTRRPRPVMLPYTAVDLLYPPPPEAIPQATRAHSEDLPQAIPPVPRVHKASPPGDRIRMI